MNKEKLIKAVKIIIITFLVLMISLLVTTKWKSDVIMEIRLWLRCRTN